MANVDTHEEFWGITLSTDNKTYAWNPAADEEDIEHKIQVTQACLGVKAKEGERNVIEVTTEDDDGEKISCAIVSLRVGYAECMHLELGFTNAVKFALKEGSGPLSLSGVHLSAMPLDLDPEDESEEEESSEDEEDVPQLVEVVGSTATVEELPVETVAVEAPVVVDTKEVKEEKVEVLAEEKNPKKRELVEDEVAVAAKKQKPEKEEAAKVVVAAVKDEDEDDDEDDEDEDDDDDDDMDGLDMDDLDSDDEDIDMDDVDSDDLESDEDDEEDDDEDETEEEETPKPKKKPPPKVNGVTKAAPTKQTPKPKEKVKPNKPSANKENVDNSNKTAATPKTKTKDTPKKDTTTPKKTPEELRTFLLKSPNLPKKYEKFSNFLKNNMKVTDAKTQKELWEYVQKNKK